MQAETRTFARTAKAKPADGSHATMAVGSAVAVAVGGVVVLATAVGALLIARAAIRASRKDGASAASEPEELTSASPIPSVRAARTAAALAALRHLAYWWFMAVATGASWLARLARPSAD